MNYYQVLELEPTAALLDIKKAYRRLALQYHPDRNQQAGAKERFQQIGEAYQCLSDPEQRRLYDLELQRPTVGGPGRYQRPPGRRPFSARTQFDDLFRNDPFFRDYFESDEAVVQEVKRAQRNLQPQNSSSNKETIKEGWFPWLLRQCGIQFTMTTVSTDARGNVRASKISSSNKDSVVQQETHSYLNQHGERVTVRKRQVNGDMIQDKMIRNQVVERQVNGVIVSSVGGADVVAATR